MYNSVGNMLIPLGSRRCDIRSFSERSISPAATDSVQRHIVITVAKSTDRPRINASVQEPRIRFTMERPEGHRIRAYVSCRSGGTVPRPEKWARILCGTRTYQEHPPATLFGLLLSTHSPYYSTLKNASSNSGFPSYFFMKNPGILSRCSINAGFTWIPA